MRVFNAVLYLLAAGFPDLASHFAMRSIDLNKRRRRIVNDSIRNGYFM
jgi:hypothetical protein